MELEEWYSSYKPLLLSIAYRMTGLIAQAEDIVQDVFETVQLQAHRLEERPLHNPRAYLCKAVTNRCLDYLKSAQKQREVYVGPWLPEPVVQPYTLSASGAGSRESATGASASDPLQAVLLGDAVSYAFLVMLDRLNPIERAVFLLREVFEFDYKDVADFVGRTQTGCRQIFSRLKRKIELDPPSEPLSAEHCEELVTGFLHAAATGDMERLLALLSEDIVLYSDGGGKVLAAVRPIESSGRVLAFLQGLAAKSNGQGDVRQVLVNGQLGFVMTSPSEPFPTLVSLEWENGRIRRMYLLRNPDKLQHLELAVGLK